MTPRHGVTAEQIARGLGGPYHREGKSWRTGCPWHTGTADNALALWDDPATGRVRVQCFGGCDWRDIRRELRALGFLEGQERDQRYHQAQSHHTRPARPAKPPLPGPATPPSGRWRAMLPGPATPPSGKWRSMT